MKSIIKPKQSNRRLSHPSLGTHRCDSEIGTLLMSVVSDILFFSPYLSLRDVQHLLVHASSKKGLNEEKTFRRNAVGKYCMFSVDVFSI